MVPPRHNIPTVTVAISAFNEAANIRAWLDSVLAQAEDGFALEKILIISDGSTEGTTEIVRSVKDARIELRVYSERIGKSSHLNEIYQGLKSDILVQSDADVVFDHSQVVRDIIQPLLNDPAVGMCGGRPLPVAGTTFIERAVNCTAEVFDGFRSSVRGGDNVFSVDGRILAYRRALVKQIVVPADMITNDAYTYFCARTLGWEYRYVPTAAVRFRSPQTLNDQLRQNTRFIAGPSRMRRYFAPSLVNHEYHVPQTIYWRALIAQFVRHPFLCGYIFLVNRYCALRARLNEKRLTAVWDIATTTKNV